MGIVRRASTCRRRRTEVRQAVRARSSIGQILAGQIAGFDVGADVDRMLEQAVDRRHDVKRPVAVCSSTVRVGLGAPVSTPAWRSRLSVPSQPMPIPAWPSAAPPPSSAATITTPCRSHAADNDPPDEVVVDDRGSAARRRRAPRRASGPGKRVARSIDVAAGRRRPTACRPSADRPHTPCRATGGAR